MTDMVFCRACGKEIHKTAPSCPQCGAVQWYAKRCKNKVAAGMLGIFLGGLGIHRFYLGQWWGIFYLLFCWTGVPWLIGLIEGIVFLCTRDERWELKYSIGPNNDPGSGKRSSSGVGLAIIIVLAGVASYFIVSLVVISAIEEYVGYASKAGVVSAARDLIAVTPA